MWAVQRTESESVISLWRLLTESFTRWLFPGGVFRQGSVWKVPADDRDATLPGNFLSIKNRLLVLQYLMSEVVSGLVPAWVWREQQWNASMRCLNEELYFKHWRSIHTFLDNGGCLTALSHCSHNQREQQHIWKVFLIRTSKRENIM